MFYTQSVVPSPQSMFYTDWVNQHKQYLFCQYVRRCAFMTKTRTIILFRNITFMNSFGFWGNSYKEILLQNEMEHMLVQNMQPD